MKYLRTRRAIAALIFVAGAASAAAGVHSGGISSAHADSPTLTIDPYMLQSDPLSLNVEGTGFSPGGWVHVDLFVAPVTFTPAPDPSGDPNVQPVPEATPLPPIPVQGTPEIVASTDITAARTINYHLHGHIFTSVGGYFNTTLTSDSPTCGPLAFWMVATDQRTGQTYTTGTSIMDSPCS